MSEFSPITDRTITDEEQLDYYIEEANMANMWHAKWLGSRAVGEPSQEYYDHFDYMSESVAMMIGRGSTTVHAHLVEQERSRLAEQRMHTGYPEKLAKVDELFTSARQGFRDEDFVAYNAVDFNFEGGSAALSYNGYFEKEGGTMLQIWFGEHKHFDSLIEYHLIQTKEGRLSILKLDHTRPPVGKTGTFSLKAFLDPDGRLRSDHQKLTTTSEDEDFSYETLEVSFSIKDHTAIFDALTDEINNLLKLPRYSRLD